MELVSIVCKAILEGLPQRGQAGRNASYQRRRQEERVTCGSRAVSPSAPGLSVGDDRMGKTHTAVRAARARSCPSSPDCTPTWPHWAPRLPDPSRSLSFVVVAHRRWNWYCSGDSHTQGLSIRTTYAVWNGDCLQQDDHCLQDEVSGTAHGPTWLGRSGPLTSGKQML